MRDVKGGSDPMRGASPHHPVIPRVRAPLRAFSAPVGHMLKEWGSWNADFGRK